MKIPARFRLLLTGTPLQNNLQELTSLLAFIMPKDFLEAQESLDYIFKHKAKTTDADHSALLSAQRIRRARSMMTPFVLRRRKAQVLKHLPSKTARVEYCDLVESQQAIYDALKTQQRKVLEDRAAGIPNKDHANVLMKLRLAVIHPLLARKIYNEKLSEKIAKAVCKDPDLPGRDWKLVLEDLVPYNDFEVHQLCQRYPKTLSKYELRNLEWMDSGKVKKLTELLHKFKANGDRVLVFSQFKLVMDILEAVFEVEKISFSRLDGNTPVDQRQALLDQFTDDESITVFMLSTKSGGAGINLAAANKVVIFDLSFNPQDDVQAENRAHRVGQTREVEVIRLVTRDTIEEQIYALGVSKIQLDSMVSGEDAVEDKKAEKRIESEFVDQLEDMLVKEMVNDVGKNNETENNNKTEKDADKLIEEEAQDLDREDGKKDIRSEFLDGLKSRGLDMSAA
jgi:SWI/SNF-related matrix-associated actin-dependent regulator of chromatin subfamily A containing DEAD/H box 1